MKSFSDDSNGKFPQWDPRQEDELARSDEETRQVIGQLLGAVPTAADTAPPPDKAAPEQLQGKAMEALRDRATEHCLQTLDAALQEIVLSRLDLPADDLSIDAFGTLCFARIQTDDEEGAIQIRLQLAPGKLVTPKSVLACDQRLWSSYTHPSSLAILLLPQGDTEIQIAEGPTSEEGELVWNLPRAGLAPHWIKYQPRLDYLVPDAAKADLRYAIGQAASAESGPAVEETAEPVEAVHIFSEQAESDTDLVIGVEWRPGQVEKLRQINFATFRERLCGTLKEKNLACTSLSEFPSSGRIYLRVEITAREQVAENIALLNRQLAEY